MTRAAAVVAVLLVAGGCAGRRGVETAPIPGSVVGVYRGAAIAGDGTSRAFRARLFVARPDRVHLEVSGPVGGPRWIVDGGSGRLSVVSVSEGTAWIGAADPWGLSRAIGIEGSLEDLVAAILDGRRLPGDGMTVREPAAENTLPERLQVTAGGAVLRLERLRIEPLDEAASARLGTGWTPPGLRVERLEDLAAEGVRWAEEVGP